MKRRILCLLLCLCMLASTAILFSSCGKKSVDLEGYSVVWGSEVTDTTADLIRTFVSTLEKKADCDFEASKVKADDAVADEQDAEILIGNTNRAETQKALKKVKGHGYVIMTVGKKLVIAGTTPLLTAMAIDHFEDEILPTALDGSSLTVTRTVVDEMEMLEFTGSWAFIYSNRLDGKRDYINSLITECKAAIGKFSDITGSAMGTVSDKGFNISPEVLVGLVDREETDAFIAGMDINNYGVGVKNGKILVTALNDTMQQKAFALFTDVLKDSVCAVEEDGKEKNRIFLPAEFSRIYSDTSNKKHVTDFPRPEGAVLSGSIDVHDSAMEYYYTGSSLGVETYTAYCKTLEAAGYTLYSGSEAEGSIFRIYNDQAENISLYVAYNAFKHASAQGVTSHEPAIRIVASPLGATKQLATEYLSRGAYEKKQDSSITSLKLSYTFPTKEEQEQGVARIFGNLYVVTLEDGSFIVLDGGAPNSTDADRIYNVLLELYKEGHNGNGPTTNDPIRITAWYLSHGHNDHYGSMVTFMKTYCKSYNTKFITVDYVIANFASDEEYYNSESGNLATQYNHTVRDKLTEYSSWMSDAPGEKTGFDYIKVHTGQRFWFANIELEVMYTHEDLYPEQIHVYNNTSTVIRMTMYHTENGEVSANSKTTMLWTGDAQTAASKWMRATYGAYLQSDMVQVAHHGGNGCEWEFYQLVNPVCVWWPTSRKSYREGFHDPKSDGYKKVSYNINYKLTSAQYIILSDDCNYTLTITANGPEYGIYDAITNKSGVRTVADGTKVAYYSLTENNKSNKGTGSISSSLIKTLHNNS
ncbi:MAG: hypothetical protein IJW51_06895 [Clostridia bacterium]|nr:hypothetical protein [Clostridia bacterium]